MTLDAPTYPPDVDHGGGLLAGLAAKLDLHIGSMSKLAKRMADAQQKPPAQPVFGRTTAAGIGPAAGLLVLRFGLAGPDQGHFWYIRGLTLLGTDPSVAVAGKVFVYVSAAGLQNQSLAGGLSSLGSADMRDTSATLPWVSTFYGRGVMPLRFNEEVFMVVTGATSGQQYIAGCQFEDYEEAAVTEGWSV